MGANRLTRGIFDVPIELYCHISLLSCLPLMIIWFGSGESGLLFLIFPRLLRAYYH